MIDLPLPRLELATVIVPAPGSGPGNWTGAPSAVLHDGMFWLAYRVRGPVDQGRGVAVVLARSADGVRFETVGRLTRDSFGAASLERPALVRTPDGTWRLYISCATPNSKHWWIEALDAETVEELPLAHSVTVLPGCVRTAVKDPVVQVDASGWHMWVCCHPLEESGHEDRMTSRYASSPDGLTWTLHAEVLAPTAGSWDQRGTRITAVFPGPPAAVMYDGRSSAAENWYERTGVALRGTDGRFVPSGRDPIGSSPDASGALRYLSAVSLPEGGYRLFFEAARPDGAHDLVTQLVARRALQERPGPDRPAGHNRS
jgi:hypothetical protein